MEGGGWKICQCVCVCVCVCVSVCVCVCVFRCDLSVHGVCVCDCMQMVSHVERSEAGIRQLQEYYSQLVLVAKRFLHPNIQYNFSFVW